MDRGVNGDRPPTTTATHDSPADAIAEEERRLADLEHEQAIVRARLGALRATRVSVQASARETGTAPGRPDASVPRTRAEKVRLFRSLFRGRPDVYPTRFESKKTGKAGYAPACSNKFVRGLCELPKVKCGSCPNQAFREPDDAAVFAHLRGQHVMGVYPLLEDDTCWFLALDFDKASWIDDVKAFIDTCNDARLPAAVERSRSGNGAHVWFFFSEPVTASTARAFGCHLLTETMSRRHEWAGPAEAASGSLGGWCDHCIGGKS